MPVTPSDVEGRTRAEEALALSEAKFHRLFDSIMDGFVIVDMAGTIRESNEVYRKMLGYSVDELAMTTYIQLTPERWHAAEARVVAEQILPRGYSDVYEKEYRRKDGSVFPVELRTVLLRESGTPSAMWAIVRDISERKAAEHALHESENRFRLLASETPVGIFQTEVKGKLVFANPTFLAMTGLSEAESRSEWQNVIHPEDRERVFREWQEAAFTAKTFSGEYRHRLPDGRDLWVRSLAKPLRDGAGACTGFVGAVVDITESRALQAQLGQSIALYRTLTRNFPNGLVGLFNRDLRFVLIDGTNTITSTDPRSWVGRIATELTPPEHRARVEAAYRSALDGHSFFFEIELRGRTLEIAVHPIRDERGEVPLGLVMSQDVTEIRALQARRVIASRLAAMETLVTGMAHEINNPLAADLGGQEVAEEEIREIAEIVGGMGPLDRGTIMKRLAYVSEILGETQASGRRAAHIVHDLKVFGNPSPLRVRVRLADVVDRLVSEHRASVTGRADLRVEHGGAPDVSGSVDQLQLVLGQLLENAAEAIPEGKRGNIIIRTGPGDPGMACMEVSDDGMGMGPEVLERAFDPFFSTRKVGKGTGLGLAICHAIAAAHGGTLVAKSEPGKGSTFRVELPAAPADA